MNHSWGQTGKLSSGRLALNFPAAGPIAPVKPKRNVLRRKHSGLIQEQSNHQQEPSSDSTRANSSSSIPRPPISREPSVTPSLDRTLTESPMEVRTAQSVEISKTIASTTTIYPELDRYQNYKPFYRSESPMEVPFKIATQDLPPPTPVFSGTSSHSQLSGYSASPSTRFSESPGPGAYSRDTTPTSMCSQSPGLISSMRGGPGPRMKQGSISPGQTRPPVSRRRAGSNPNEGEPYGSDPHGLAAVRESLNSSSSNSTVREPEMKHRHQHKKHLPPPPPSPPLRKSSQKFRKNNEDDAAESPARKPRQAMMASPPPSKPPMSSRGKPQASSSKPPPTRPSRDGTPDLQSQQFPVPVIHSNLSSSSIPERHERHQSPSLMPSALPRSTTPSSHQPSRLAPRREPTPAPATSGSEKRDNSKEGRTARTPSPGVSNFRSRFPIFGRRKTEPATATQEKASSKLPRKGPAAGTGHEGYGKIGTVRRRSTSNATSGGKSLPSSQESLASDDPFLMDRVNPVIIAGGEVVENRNESSELSRVESGGSTGGYTSASSMGSHAGRTTMWPSAFQDRGLNAGPNSRRPSNGSTDSEGPGLHMKNTLAFRRSIQKLRSSPDSQVKLPKPIVVRPPGGVTSPSINSLDSTGIMSDDSSVPPPHNPLPATNGPKKLTKKPGRWNFFGRSQAKKAAETPKTVQAAVSVAPPEPQRKAVPFYAMVDSSEQEDEGAFDVEDVLLEANILPQHAMVSRERRRPSTSAAEPSRPPLSSTNIGRRPSTSAATPRSSGGHLGVPSGGNIVPSIHRRTPSGTTVPLSPPRPLPHTRSASTSAVPTTVPAFVDPFSTSSTMSPPAQQAPKRSRLPQVGRIPKVVSGRQQPQAEAIVQASPKSFSRPFNRLSVSGAYTPPQQLAPQFVGADTQSLAKGPSPPRPATPELTREASTITTITSGTGRMSRDMTNDGRGLAGQGCEFLAFSPPRKNSNCTTSTTSSCSGGITSYAAATAVVPTPDAPLAEDEIWDEYNDLIGEVPPSATSSHGRPFYLEGVGSKLESPIGDAKMTLPSIAASLAPPTEPQKEFRISKAPTASSCYSQDMTAKIAEVMNNTELPTTPFSVSEFVGGYGDRQHSLDMRVTASKLASPEGKTNSIQKVSASQRSSTSSKKSKRTNSSASSRLTAEDDSDLAQVNLRVGSMTVSKWLTFGHVLFSPIREDLESLSISQSRQLSADDNPDSDPKRQSILVIDGLGNDDWSFYAAETYPGATFYNLSPRAPLSEAQKRASTGGFPLTPRNHHQIQFSDNTTRFPFGTDSFTSVVYRFPIAAPESHYRNIIAEARRVLKPGGFLELSILDVDFNNMGNRGRRAVRGLKEKIHATKPDLNLSSTADLMLKILNRRGFTDVKTCKVGVPVCALPKKKVLAAEKDKKQKKKNTMEQRSLADMMSDTSELADKEITNMVAQVGRWWYSKCYENTAGIGVAGSMWRDRSLLNECQEMGTSLKLMVCYARVPEKGGLGRVASI
ncbi:hypothetical protein MKZ38_008973 [Zalerion maritima]|uniref:Methyltransferase type 11 domain-containing protein n=1 Tax=Zalerion maritima TaxID=339359 RepID=A0AAD5WTR2_9PEZI|nr:hypothetical protein MKZ38_008973 [Zalerion maritima]